MSVSKLALNLIKMMQEVDYTSAEGLSVAKNMRSYCNSWIKLNKVMEEIEECKSNGKIWCYVELDKFGVNALEKEGYEVKKSDPRFYEISWEG